MNHIKDKVVIITGSSSGIGEACARELVGRGMKVMLAARRTDRLKQLAEELSSGGGSVAYHQTDVTKKDQTDALAQATLARFGRIDVLVSNAGLMPLAPLEKLKVDEWERMVDVNIKGVMYGFAAVLPQMLKQGSGHIINVSSVAGHVVFPGAAVYCATKFAVRAFSEGIRQESKGRFRSTIISPGAVESELADHITDEQSREAIGEFVAIAIKPDAIARAVAFAIEQPDDVDVNEMIIRPSKQDL